MESILFSIKQAEFYLMCGAVLVVVGGVMITRMYEFLREKAAKASVPAPQATQAPAQGNITIKL
jgi:uncharacterized membrane protein